MNIAQGKTRLRKEPGLIFLAAPTEFFQIIRPPIYKKAGVNGRVEVLIKTGGGK